MNVIKIALDPLSCMSSRGKSGKFRFDIYDIRDCFFLLPSISYETSVGHVISPQEQKTGEIMEYWISFTWLRFKLKILIHESNPEWDEDDF